MIPEQAKSEIIRKRAEGMTWDSIADWMDEKYGVRVHRTSIQRCHDRELWGEEEDFLPPEDRVRLDKQVSHSKGEANLYKKLYQWCFKRSRRARCRRYG